MEHQCAVLHLEARKYLGRLVRHLNMTSLIRLELDLPLFLKDLPFSNRSLPLEYLYLRSFEDSTSIARFLEATPYLKVLRVAWSHHALPIVLKPQIIPQLSELGGEWSFCASILPGRPISRVELFSMPSRVGRDQGKVLASSTKSLIGLKIPLLSSIDIQFWEHFPDLESLEIRPFSFDETWGEVGFFSLKNNPPNFY